MQSLLVGTIISEMQEITDVGLILPILENAVHMLDGNGRHLVQTVSFYHVWFVFTFISIPYIV